MSLLKKKSALKRLIVVLRMAQKLREDVYISFLGGKATFQISFEHHAEIKGSPRWSHLPHLLLKRIKRFPGITYVFLELFTLIHMSIAVRC